MTTPAEDRIRRLERRLEREVRTRESAEDLLERKSAELFESNRLLQALNTQLEARVRERTLELERQRTAAELTARRDHLTGLPNRLDFSIELPRMIEQAESAGQDLTLMAIDLDRFKRVNDDHGHQTGDKLLQAISDRLRSDVRPNERVFRLGGDEFALVMIGSDGVANVANRLHATICTSMSIGAASVNVGASIGIAQRPRHADCGDLLMKYADLAAYDAKSRGGGIQFFDPKLLDAQEASGRLATALQQALDEGGIDAWLQPIICARRLTLVGAEALARWQQADGGFVPPNEFIPIAEQAGLIGTLGQHILRQACRAARPMIDAGLLSYISVNLSPIQLADPDLDQVILAILAQEGLLPANLLIEITENVLLVDTPRVHALMQKLVISGVRFALDDFGVGYSNLRYLRDFPVAKLKIDRSFLIEAEDSAAASAIISAITNLAHQLAIKVVVEGVETDRQLAMIRGLDCDLVQGFGIARPMPAERFRDWLTKSPPEPRPVAQSLVERDRTPSHVNPATRSAQRIAG